MYGPRFMVVNFGCGVQGLACRVQGAGCVVAGAGVEPLALVHDFVVSGSGLRGSGFQDVPGG